MKNSTSTQKLLSRAEMKNVSGGAGGFETGLCENCTPKCRAKGYKRGLCLLHCVCTNL